jgi:hypothetical protein
MVYSCRAPKAILCASKIEVPVRVARRIELTAELTSCLEQRSRARSLPARVVERARIVLLAALVSRRSKSPGNWELAFRNRRGGVLGF